VNNKLLDIPSIVRAISSVGYDEVSFPAFVEDKEIKKYAYIVLPYAKYGTLLTLIQKASKKGKTLSLDLVKYLFKQLLESICQLH